MLQRHPIYSVPPGAAVNIRVFAVPAVGHVTVKFLGRLRSVFQHWGAKSGVMCQLDACSLCKKNGPCPRLVGFAPALVWRAGQYQDWAPIALQVTEQHRERISHSVLPGTTWDCFRAKGETGHVEVFTDFLYDEDLAKLPDEFDVEPAVCLAYKVLKARWVPEPTGVKTLSLASFTLPPPQLPSEARDKQENAMANPNFAAELEAWKKRHGISSMSQASRDMMVDYPKL